MTNSLRLVIALAASLAIHSLGLAQGTEGGGRMPAEAKSATPAAPAPVRDINGDWHGAPEPPKLSRNAVLTDWGQSIVKARQTLGGGLVGRSNDPMVKCDPLGFPRDVLWETRGLEFVQVPKKMLMLFQYQRVWREAWMDGRPLPTRQNVSKADQLLADPRYYGYSIGHWDGDYNFVVETTNLDEDTWVDEFGDPHSENAHVTENYHRADHDTLELTVTIDDPKAYKVPFVVADKVTYKWNPRQELDEQLCIPSSAQAYMDAIAGPAAADKNKK